MNKFDELEKQHLEPPEPADNKDSMIDSRNYTIDEVEDIEIDGVDTKDYPDFCDAYIQSAYWIDTGEPLTDTELDKLNDNSAEYIAERAFEMYI